MATHPLAIRCPFGQGHEAQDPAAPIQPESLAVRRSLSISMDKCRICRNEVVTYIAGCAAEFTRGAMISELFEACAYHTLVVDTLARRPLDREQLSLQDLVRIPSWMLWPRTVEFMRRGWVRVELPNAWVELDQALSFARGLCVADRREIVDDALDRAAGVYSLSVEQLHAFRGA